MGHECFVLQLPDHFPVTSRSASVLQRCHRAEWGTGRVKPVYLAIFFLPTVEGMLQLTVLKCFLSLTVQSNSASPSFSSASLKGSFLKNFQTR